MRPWTNPRGRNPSADYIGSGRYRRSAEGARPRREVGVFARRFYPDRNGDFGVGAKYCVVCKVRRNPPASTKLRQAGDRNCCFGQRARHRGHPASHAGRLLHLWKSGPRPAGRAQTGGRIRNRFRTGKGNNCHRQEMETVRPMSLDWGVAGLPLDGQAESGDRHVVQSFPGGFLLAVIDGLGHGYGAAMAATAAEFILRAEPQEPLISLVRHCHESLRPTRGVVMSVVSFDTSHGLMTWLGVGNARGILIRSGLSANVRSEELLLRAGVIGEQIPPLQASVFPV